MELTLNDNRWLLSFDVDEELPLGLWTDLVKWRAGYKCQECGKEAEKHSNWVRSKLVAHHVKARSSGGKSTLSNGMCLCYTCHGKYRTMQECQEPTINYQMLALRRKVNLTFAGSKG